jgi:ribonuclease HI
MYTLYTDGSAIPNPGPCGAGAILIDADDKIIWTLSEYLGEGTNNVGELTAILRGLHRFSELDLDGESLNIFSDSELSVHLINGVKKTSKPHLIKILERILKMKENMSFTIAWVKAHDTNKWNNYADVLANNAVANIVSSCVKPVATVAQQPYQSTSTTLPVLKQSSQQPNTTRILLSCSFKEKDKVKALGARWDPENKSWWVEDKPENQETFAKWIASN